MEILKAEVIKGNYTNISNIGDNWWRLNEDVVYLVTTEDAKFKHFVPKGFECDMASIPPQVLWLLGSKPYIMKPAALLHDYFYKNHGVSREYADRVMLKLMREYDNPKEEWKRQAIYWAVVIFGGKPWKLKS